MNVLVVPMFALSRMGGPWSRTQTIAAAFESAGHHVVLGIADDGNCINPCVADTCELPVPSPLGLPKWVSARTFPIATKLGIAGRKPVRSFEEVLWLTGALAYAYERESVDAICSIIESRGIDAVYSEYSLPAIIAARLRGVPVFGSFSFTTQASYASAPAKAGGVCKLLAELGLPPIESALDLFGWLDRRFVPSCKELEPIQDGRTEFVGFLHESLGTSPAKRDCILVYLGSGSVPQQKVERVAVQALRGFEGTICIAGCKDEHREGNVQCALRFNFAELLPRACCFVHHGGQNSMMDAFSHAVPQVIVPGNVFERIYNAESVERAGVGVKLESFDAPALGAACHRVIDDPSFAEASNAIRQKLAQRGGAAHIVSVVEGAIGATQGALS